MNTNERPLADNILWRELERLFFEPITLSQKEGENFLIEIKEQKLNYSNTVTLNKDVEGEECKYVFRSTALGKQRIIATDPIFQKENVQKMIKINHLKYTKSFNTLDVRAFIYGEIALIDQVIERKCPRGEKSQTNWERTLYFILQDYKVELSKYLIEQTKQVQEDDKQTDSKEPKKQLRQDAFKKIILPILEKFTNINELSKDDKGDLIRLIVGCNAIDGYQNVYTGKEIKYNKDLNESDIKIMKRLKERLKLKER
jgi:hypothetical protein